MRTLTTDEIDRELESRTKEVTAMSSTLLELENHPGLAHVRLYPPTGATAQRWEVIEKSLAQLWEDLGRMTSILDDARTVRARRSKPEDDDRVELTRLLREQPLEVSRHPIPLSQRKFGGLGEAVEYVGLADTAERMHAAYPAVVDFLDAVDLINSLIADKLAPIQERLDAAGTAGPEEIARLLQTSATDPLSLTTQDVEKRIAAIADRVEERSAELAELAAIQSNWPEALATTGQLLDELRDVSSRATCRSCWRARSRTATTPNPPCVLSCSPSRHGIRRRFGRFGVGSRPRCAPRMRKKGSRRACSTVAANSRAG
jgi:hypothetical protein